MPSNNSRAPNRSDANAPTSRSNEPTERQTASVRRWLARKARRESVWAVVGALALVFAGLFALLCTFVSISVFLWRLRFVFFMTSGTVMTISVGAIVLLFVVEALVPREAFEPTRTNEGGRHQARRHRNVRIAHRVGMIGSGHAMGLHALIDPTTFLTLVSSLLLVGPRSLKRAIGFFNQGVRLSRLDVSVCATTLAILFAADRRVSFASLADRLGRTNMEKAQRQLRDIDGVLYLAADPAGLALSSDLKRDFLESRTRSKKPS